MPETFKPRRFISNFVKITFSHLLPIVRAGSPFSPAALERSFLRDKTKPLTERVDLDYSYVDSKTVNDNAKFNNSEQSGYAHTLIKIDEIYYDKISAPNAKECDRQDQEIEALGAFFAQEFRQLLFAELNEVECQKAKHWMALSLFLKILETLDQLESLLLHLYNQLTKSAPIIIGDDGYTKYGGSIVLAIVDGNSAKFFKISGVSLISCSVIAYLEINRNEKANLEFSFDEENALVFSVEDGDSVSIKEKSLVVIGERTRNENVQLLIRQYCGPVNSNSDEIKLAYYKDGSHKEENLPVGNLVGVVVGALSFEDTKEILSIYDAPEIVFPQRN